MELNYKHNNNAFSLLELIIAIAILSGGFVVIIQALSFSARIAALSEDIASAVFLTEDKMQELEFKEKRGLINREPQLVQDKKDRFSWQYLINQDTELSLYRLDFEVNWQRANRKEKLDLSTYLR